MLKKMKMISTLFVVIFAVEMLVVGVRVVYADNVWTKGAHKETNVNNVVMQEKDPVSADRKASIPTENTASNAAQGGEVIMAWVGDKKITVEQFMNYIKQDTRLVIKATKVSGRVEILREMILDLLIEEGMYKDGLLPKDRTPNAKEYLQAYQKFTSQHFPKANEVPSEKELYKYYQQHPESFGIPAMVRISQIQFRIPDGADEKTKELVKAEADETLKRLRAGESFSDLAEVLTDSPLGKVAKGDLGFLQVDKDQWLKKATAVLEVGQFSEVLESPVGYEIILLQDKRDAMVAPYANVRSNVVSQVRQEAQAKAREEYAWSLAKTIRVTVEQSELKSALPDTIH